MVWRDGFVHRFQFSLRSKDLKMDFEIGQQVKAWYIGYQVTGRIVEEHKETLKFTGSSVSYRLLLDNKPVWANELVWVGSWAIIYCQCGSNDRVEPARPTGVGACWDCRSLNDLAQTMTKILVCVGMAQ